jgi:hypothetical protein
MKEAIHISFHDGCIADVEIQFSKVNIKVTSIKLPRKDMDDFIFERRASRKIAPYLKIITENFKNLIISDIAPLACPIISSREMFSDIKILHYICNRFDTFNQNKDYYQDFLKLQSHENSKIIVYTEYENIYLNSKGFKAGYPVLKPSGLSLNDHRISEHAINSNRNSYLGKKYGLLMPYINENIFKDQILSRIPNLYFGKYYAPSDLKEFEFFIHFPCTYSNYYLFELLRTGKKILVPSLDLLAGFLKKININYFFSGLPRRKRFLMTKNQIINQLSYSEWYNPCYRKYITYFSSFDEIINKLDGNSNAEKYNQEVDYEVLDDIYKYFD